jgi:hypothetical protein
MCRSSGDTVRTREMLPPTFFALDANVSRNYSWGFVLPRLSFVQRNDSGTKSE